MPPKCRPALNYYLISTWPPARDQPCSRFINERAHANIQKDGTYSVVPRMWGGLTTPAELRAIANVADKFGIPTVKVTGGQRIDLLGVKKEDPLAVWNDLRKAGMVVVLAYAKGLRTVKTCGQRMVPLRPPRISTLVWASSWKRCAGVPGHCTRSSSRSRDVRATAPRPPSRIWAWSASRQATHFPVGGNGGVDVRVTEPLVRVASEEEVLEYAGAFMQLYREEAHYSGCAPRPGLSASALITSESGWSRMVREEMALQVRFLRSQIFCPGRSLGLSGRWGRTRMSSLALPEVEAV